MDARLDLVPHQMLLHHRAARRRQLRVRDLQRLQLRRAYEQRRHRRYAKPRPRPLPLQHVEPEHLAVVRQLQLRGIGLELPLLRPAERPDSRDVLLPDAVVDGQGLAPEQIAEIAPLRRIGQRWSAPSLAPEPHHVVLQQPFQPRLPRVAPIHPPIVPLPLGDPLACPGGRTSTFALIFRLHPEPKREEVVPHQDDAPDKPMVLEPMARLLELPRPVHGVILRLAQFRLHPPDGREPVQHPLALPG